MKKIIVTMVCLFTMLTMQAQYLHLYKNGSLLKSYVTESIDSMLFDTSGSVYYMDLYNNGTKHRVDNLGRIDNFKISGEPIKSGVYLGVIAFSDDFQLKPIGDLNSATKSAYQSFVSSQTMKGSTHLYYAVENAIKQLKEIELPEDLVSVSLVTFTDGLDDGSLFMTSSGYTSNDEYLTELNNQIKNTKISNLDINAYAIGFDEGFVVDMDLFNKNLRMLSSKEENATTVKSIKDVENSLKEISDQIHQENHFSSVSVIINGKENGTILRVTLDGTTAAASKKYIEGTFNFADQSLLNVKYVGVTSESGSTVPYDTRIGNSKFQYIFEDVKTLDGSTIDPKNINFWTYIPSSGLWQETNEGDTGSEPEVETLKKSAVVVFVLDCSSSLSNNFTELKTYANNFISTLAGYGNDEAFSAIDLRGTTPEDPVDPNPVDPEDPVDPVDPNPVDPEDPMDPNPEDPTFADFDIFDSLEKDEMIAVEGGTFLMGAQSTTPPSYDWQGIQTPESYNYDSDARSDESPVHEVTLSDFYIGKYEVTQQLWEYVMTYSGTTVSGDVLNAYADPWLGENPYIVNDYYPACYVSWEDIVDVFLPRLNSITGRTFRLPTEAEWEYAARGGSKSQGYKYSGSNIIQHVACYNDYTLSNSCTVGTKMPNELMIYDMSGNVREWCSDWFGSYSSSAQTNPTGPTTGSNRVARGGSWGSIAQYCRVSRRDCYAPGNRSSYIGLRLVCSRL